MSRTEKVKPDPKGRQKNETKELTQEEEERCLCGKKLNLENSECYDHMTRGY